MEGEVIFDGINYYECCVCGSYNEGFARCSCKIKKEQEEIRKVLGIFRKNYYKINKEIQNGK